MFFRVTYFSYLYQRNIAIIIDEINFHDDYAYFTHMGKGEKIPVSSLVKIEGIE